MGENILQYYTVRLLRYNKKQKEKSSDEMATFLPKSLARFVTLENRVKTRRTFNRPVTSLC